MNELAIWIAAGLSSVWFLVHTFVGGRQISKPFKESTSLDHTILATMWMCWNMVTGCLFVLAALFFMGAVDKPEYALAGALVSSGIAVGGIATKFALPTTFQIIPQGWLFVPTAALGFYGYFG